jgi:hypothetical protein
VPADHRPPLENFQCVQYSRSHTIEPRKHEAVHIAERQSLRGFAPQHVELVSKDKDLGFQRSPRPEQSDQGAPDQPAKIAHRSEYRLIRGRGQPFPAEGPKNAMLQLERLDRALDGKLMICRGC